MRADSSVGVPIAAMEPSPIHLYAYAAPARTKSRSLAVIPRPAMARMEWLGQVWVLRHWSAAKWNAIPRRLRPANAIMDDEGGARVIEPEVETDG